MNNKKTGSDFEREFCRILADKGYWVHFMSPDSRGAQPFDVIAVKNGMAIAVDCKTSVKPIFSISRLEDNQIMAFEKWISCGNSTPFVAVKYENNIFLVSYLRLKCCKKVDFRKEQYDVVYSREQNQDKRAD